jgi:hypothetical protein
MHPVLRNFKLEVAYEYLVKRQDNAGGCCDHVEAIVLELEDPKSDAATKKRLAKELQNTLYDLRAEAESMLTVADRIVKITK